MPRSGADLALLLLGGYRALVDAAMLELAARGYEDFRPSHEFAMRAIAAGADSASDLARHTGVSKQAAAKTIGILLDRGYVSRETDPQDARRKPLQVTTLGQAVLREGEGIFEELHGQWEEKIGAAELLALEQRLRTLVDGRAVDPGRSGWTELTTD